MPANSNILESPIADFVRREWSAISEDITSAKVTCDDVVLYLIWALDGMRTDDGTFSTRLWENLRSALNDHFIATDKHSTRDDTNLITDAICALALKCIGLLLTSHEQYRTFYLETIHNFSPAHWQNVEKHMQAIQYGEQTKPLQQWLLEYFSSDKCLTTSDTIEWDSDFAETYQLLATNLHKSNGTVNMVINLTQQTYIDKFENNGTYNDNSISTRPHILK